MKKWTYEQTDGRISNWTHGGGFWTNMMLSLHSMYRYFMLFDHTVIPLGHSSIPLSHTFIPLDRISMPLDHICMILNRISMQFYWNCLPLDHTSMPLNHTSMPLDRISMLFDCNCMPLDRATINGIRSYPYAIRSFPDVIWSRIIFDPTTEAKHRFKWLGSMLPKYCDTLLKFNF